MNEVVDDPEFKDFERPDASTIAIHVRGYDSYDAANVKKYEKQLKYYNKVAERASKMGFSNATILTGDHHLTQIAALKNHTLSAAAKKSIQATEKKIASIE